MPLTGGSLELFPRLHSTVYLDNLIQHLVLNYYLMISKSQSHAPILILNFRNICQLCNDHLHMNGSNELKINFSLGEQNRKGCKFTPCFISIGLSYVLCAQLCLTLCHPMDCNRPGSSIHEISQGRLPEWSCHCLLQGIFLNQRSNPCLLHWQADSLPSCRHCVGEDS